MPLSFTQTTERFTMPPPPPKPKGKYDGFLESRGIKNKDNRTPKQVFAYYLNLAYADSVDQILCLRELNIHPNHPLLTNAQKIAFTIKKWEHYVDSLGPNDKGEELNNIGYYMVIGHMRGGNYSPYDSTLNYHGIHETLIHMDFYKQGTLDQMINDAINLIINNERDMKETSALKLNKGKYNIEDEFGLYEGTH